MGVLDLVTLAGLWA